jgi:molybdate-binding protein/transcriptional regulator with XRE-family HTH domain
MAEEMQLQNLVRERRSSRGWSQEELARRSGLSRAGISAIETARLVPSAAAALALAAALECRVEDLFRLRGAGVPGHQWAWPPPRDRCRYWLAEVWGTERLYPVEPTPLGVLPHDGVMTGNERHPGERHGPRSTLVMACCDPAVGLLAAELQQTSGIRLLALQRPSRVALALLGQGLVHVAGIHLSRSDEPRGHAAVVRSELGPGYRLLHVADWEEGITLAQGLALSTVRDAVGANLRWVGRESGSGARQCLDELLAGRQGPQRQARDHRGVAEAVRSGWADAGVCLRLASEEAGLDFLGVRRESYDLCFPSRWETDPRLTALVKAVRAPAYRRALGELPGYDSRSAGGVEHVD